MKAIQSVNLFRRKGTDPWIPPAKFEVKPRVDSLASKVIHAFDDKMLALESCSSISDCSSVKQYLAYQQKMKNIQERLTSVEPAVLGHHFLVSWEPPCFLDGR